MKLATDGASIWFITATLLPKGAKSFAGYMKCWDTTTLTEQLRDPLASQPTDIDKAYNTDFFLHSGVLTNKQEEVIHFTR